MYKSVGLYVVANGAIAFLGLLLTVVLGRALGASEFGELASLIAFQNIWAAMAFLRIDTRIATCRNVLEANKVILSGFLIGGLVSLTLFLMALVISGRESLYSAIFPAGFSLAVFDALSLLYAYNGKKKQATCIRAVRILGPLIIFTMLSALSADVQKLFGWQAFLMLCLALIMWRRWIQFRRWFSLAKATLCRYQKGLIPSVLLCLLNGIWINGITPYLNIVASPSIAGKFAMLQRVLGGCLGVISTSVSAHFFKKDFVKVNSADMKQILKANLAVSLIICTSFAYPLLKYSSELLGSGWSFDGVFYISMSLFLTCSYSVGSVSMLAVRLFDEWFVAIWQAVALLIWVSVFWLVPTSIAIEIALTLGAMMYIALAFRWAVLIKNDRFVQN